MSKPDAQVDELRAPRGTVLTRERQVMGLADTIRPLALAIESPAPTLGLFIGCNEFYNSTFRGKLI